MNAPPDPRVTTMPRPRAPQVQHPERLLRPTPLGPPNDRAIADLTDYAARWREYALHLETSNAEARRENDALRAQVARLTRKPVPWHSLALAWLVCRLEALGERINRIWAHEGWGR